MKYMNRILFFAALCLSFAACEKAKDLPYYAGGEKVTLSSPNTAITPAPADSNSRVLNLTWTDPGYATDSLTVKFVVQVDAKGNNFKDAISKTVSGRHDTGFLAKELNAYTVAHQWQFGTTYDMEARVISSYANNNDQLTSNVFSFTYTPYKVPPKVPLPESGKLFLVGDATVGGWSNPVPVPSQEFSRIDETTFAGVFQMYGGKSYLVLPENGNWGMKYSVEDNSSDGVEATGDFGFGYPNNFKGPATDGFYKITLDFQHGIYTVTPWSGHLPTDLFIVGSATPGGWNNPVPVPSQQFTRINSSEFEITLPLNGGQEYLVLPVNGDWSHKYAVADNSIEGLWAGGALGYDFGNNLPGPPDAGTYKITVNFAKGDQGMFSVVKQ